MTESSLDPGALLARAAKLRLFVMLRRTVNPALLPEKLGAHLRWMIDQEKDGRIFLSGPIAPHVGMTILDGLTVLRASSLAEAEEIGMQDPFVQSGVVAFEMREWTVNEGAIPLTVTLSDSTAVFR
jgi:uncharacterized protein YciI